MQAVGQLDQQDADVPRHRHDHLANVLGLLLFAAPELEFVQLRQPIDDPGNLCAELLLQLLQGHRGVLDGVVQERRFKARGVQVELGRYPSDGQRVLDEVLARLSELPLVGEFSESERPLDLLQVRLLVVGAHIAQEWGDPGGSVRSAQARAREAGAAALGRRLGRGLDRHLLLIVHRASFHASVRRRSQERGMRARAGTDPGLSSGAG